MELGSLLSSYKISPDAEERFSRSIIENIRGTVRVNFGAVVPPVFLLTILGVIIMGYCTVHSGILAMLLIIGYCMLTFLVLWYLLTWRIDFDGSTGFVQYHTFFGGTQTYHVSELMLFEVHNQRMSVTLIRNPHRRRGLLITMSDAFHTRRTLRVRELLQIMTADGMIVVPISSAWLESKLVHGVGGYRDAEKFQSYLDLYRRYKLENEMPDPIMQPGGQDLSPAVRAAIEAQRSKMQFAPPPEQQSIPDLESVEEISAPIPEKRPVPSANDTIRPLESPTRQPEGNAPAAPAFPDPAGKTQDPKPPVDVDKLFENVLRQHGKLK